LDAETRFAIIIIERQRGLGAPSNVAAVVRYAFTYPWQPTKKGFPSRQKMTSIASTAGPAIERLGDTSKCPVCGSSVATEAYHCTHCRSFFCYHCRARQAGGESALQCINKECGYYGKLVCDNCNPEQQKNDKPVDYLEPLDGYWPAWLGVTLVASLIVWLYSTWLAAFIGWIGLYAGVGYILQSMGFNMFGKQRLVSMQRVSKYHSCIGCSQPAKTVPVGTRKSS